MEYNVVGDTGSIGIDTSPHDYDGLTANVRYNLVIMSDWNTSIYDNMPGAGAHGIRIYDEKSGGDNSAKRRRTDQQRHHQQEGEVKRVPTHRNCPRILVYKVYRFPASAR